MITKMWLVVYAWASLAAAQETYKVPLTYSSNEIIVVKSVKSETLVRGQGFQLKIPQGWTLNPMGESKSQYSSFNAYPTEDIQQDPVFFGIHHTKRKLDLHRLTSLQKKKSHKFFERTLGQSTSLQTEYVSKRNEQVFTWYVKAKQKDYIVTAGAPLSDTSSIAKLRAILESMHFE